LQDNFDFARTRSRAPFHRSKQSSALQTRTDSVRKRRRITPSASIRPARCHR